MCVCVCVYLGKYLWRLYLRKNVLAYVLTYSSELTGILVFYSLRLVSAPRLKNPVCPSLYSHRVKFKEIYQCLFAKLSSISDVQNLNSRCPLHLLRRYLLRHISRRTYVYVYVLTYIERNAYIDDYKDVFWDVFFIKEHDFESCPNRINK